MADNVPITAGVGTLIATDDVAGEHFQRVKLVDGTADAATPIPGNAGGLCVQGGKGTLTDGSGSLVTGGASEEIFASNASRRYLLVQNVSTASMWVNFGGAATAGAGSVLLPANGGSLVFDGNYIPTGQVQIIGATTGQGYTAKEG